MYIIPVIRTTRALSACTLLPNNPLLAITLSEVLSVVCPFIKNSNQNIDIIFFLFYFYYDREYGFNIMNYFKTKDIIYYNYELLTSLLFLLFYYKIELF